MMKNDLHEPELKRHLGPVGAPDELWDRVHDAPAVKLRPSRGITLRWAAAALATAAVAVGITVGLNHSVIRDVSAEERAVLALSRAPDQLQFRSADAAELRAWVKTGTGMDVPMPAHTASSVQLVGVYVNRKGTPAAEISYRVGGVDATLVVSKIPGDGDGRHAFVKGGSYHGANFMSWSMHGQMYTIASVGSSPDARAGCILCHSTGAPGPA